MKKRHFRTLAMMAVVACMGMTSCKQLYYQVYDVKSDSLKQEDNSLVYENSDMKVILQDLSKSSKRWLGHVRIKMHCRYTTLKNKSYICRRVKL